MMNSPSLRLRVPPDARYGKFVRERLARFAAEASLTGADLREFITAIGEALANAIEHAKATDPIEISAYLVDDDIVMATVVDTGIGFAPDDTGERALPPTLAERGRGLPIMKSYVDLFTVRSEPGRGTAVILGRYLPGRRPPATPDSAG